MGARRRLAGAATCALGSILLSSCANAPTTEWVARGATLASWNDTPTKAALTAFVERVTDPRSPGYVPPADRIAVFDNDGTLWSEQPVYFQLAFALDRLRALAPDHPEWNTTEPFKSALAGDLHAVAAGGHEALFQIIGATHSGMSIDEFERIAREWARTALHPSRGVRYTALTYAPMVELLDYLRAHDFDIWIVTGGGIEFVRAVSQELYGVPADHVVGSRLALEYREIDGVGTVMRGHDLAFLDDGPGKPVGIAEHIGRVPILAVGNSDGDYEMLRYTTDGRAGSLGVLVHHTDAEREWAYDRESSIGRVVRGLDEASQRSWLLVDMAADWARVHAR